MFCSANRLAMHDRGPWPKGSTKYGCTDFCFVLVCPVLSTSLSRSHRSGTNEFGWSKYSGRRQITWFCVTTTVWNISARRSLEENTLTPRAVFPRWNILFETIILLLEERDIHWGSRPFAGCVLFPRKWDSCEAFPLSRPWYTWPFSGLVALSGRYDRLAETRLPISASLGHSCPLRDDTRRTPWYRSSGT